MHPHAAFLCVILSVVAAKPVLSQDLPSSSQAVGESEVCISDFPRPTAAFKATVRDGAQESSAVLPTHRRGWWECTDRVRPGREYDVRVYARYEYLEAGQPYVSTFKETAVVATRAGYRALVTPLSPIAGADFGLSVDFVDLTASQLHENCIIGKSLDGCLRVAQMFREVGLGSYAHKYTLEAATLAKKDCDKGNGRSCGLIGELQYLGWGTKRNAKKAKPLLERACDSGDGRGCAYLGLVFSEGEVVPKDEAKAALLFEKACDAGDGVGCNNLGLLYDSGASVARDRGKAARLFEKACATHDAQGCWNLGAVYSTGKGVAQDKVRAARLFKESCTNGVMPACSALGDAYYSSDGVGQDKAKAATLYLAACLGRLTAACNKAGQMWWSGDGVTKQPERAREAFLNGCWDTHQDDKEQMALACYGLGGS
jgi:uncharacterized protein